MLLEKFKILKPQNLKNCSMISDYHRCPQYNYSEASSMHSESVRLKTPVSFGWPHCNYFPRIMLNQLYRQMNGAPRCGDSSTTPSHSLVFWRAFVVFTVAGL